MIPFWAVLSFSAAIGATAIPLIQEKFRADGYALALWNKIVNCILFLPLMLSFGLPHDVRFYGYTVLAAMLYSVSDVLYFRAVPVIGSGMMTRLLPSSVLATFLLWFVIQPQDLHLYFSAPLKAAGIVAVFALFLISSFFIRRCRLSWSGVRLIWPVILIAAIGPLFSKLALAHAPSANGNLQAPVTYLFFQGLMILVFLGVFYRVKKPIAAKALLNRNTIRTAIIMGVVMSIVLLCRMRALDLVDNPGLVSLVFFTDALWVLLVYKLIGKRDDSNIWAGLGIVASAALLIAIKTLL